MFPSTIPFWGNHIFEPQTSHSCLLARVPGQHLEGEPVLSGLRPRVKVDSSAPADARGNVVGRREA